MFKTKKFKLVEDKNTNKMFRFEIIRMKWRNYLVLFGIVCFALLLVFGNFKSESYYKKLKAAKKEMDKKTSQIRTIQLPDEGMPRSINCVVKACRITCSGDMKDLRNYLESQKGCKSITLSISDGIFPENKLQRNWLEGNFNISVIKISMSALSKIEDGAFNQKTVSHVSEFELDGVQIQNLTENTFVGLKSIQTFTLVNQVEKFYGESFLKPMERTLKKLVLIHVSTIATDPGPWLRGGSFPLLITIVFDGSNFGGYINAASFEHLTALSLLMMNSCNISEIADGAFDFMMKHIVVLISLLNNNLKRLSGEYLTKVNSLKRVDIQNNPWDCSCDLEELLKEVKRYPEGFGESSKCSNTSSVYAGKYLSEVTLENCGDEKTTTTTEITQVISSTNPGMETVPTISSTSSVSSTTENDFSPSESVLTTTSTSTSISTTTVLTTSNEEVTTPSPQNRTTTQSAESIFIECARYKIRYRNSPESVLELSPPDGHFLIVSISETRAKLIFDEPTDDLAVIWFYEQPSLDGVGGSVRIAGEFRVGCQSELETSLAIEGLIVNRTYTFCLVKSGSKLISPFNCQSYFTSPGHYYQNETIWLRNKDKALAIIIFCVGILIAICIGLGGMYSLLHYRPNLLKDSNRVQSVNKSTGEVFIIPRPKTVTESLSGNSFSSETTNPPKRILSGLSYMEANNYEDIEYRWRMNVKNDIYSNRVPKSPAPPLPKRISEVSNKTETETSNRRYISMMEERNIDYGYTSMP